MFYQHNPYDSVWGEMHWGHAVSLDGIDWVACDIALSPHGDIKHMFSGCGVIDANNSSKLFQKDGGVILIYTGVIEDEITKNNLEHQYIAYLDDSTGKVIIPENNMIIANPRLENFRDPKVVFNYQSNLWMMVIACGDHIRFYSSKNLINWLLEESFYPPFLHSDQVIECPEISCLKDEGGTPSWLLVLSILNCRTRESETFYFIGDFDFFTFTPHSKNPQRIDSGHDFYAPQQWSFVHDLNEECPNPLWIGWMNNWAYADYFPANGWNGIMSVVRELSIVKWKESLYLSQKPIDRLLARKRERLLPVISKKEIILSIDERCSLITQIEINSHDEEDITIKLLEGENNEFRFIINTLESTCILDRSDCSFPETLTKGLNSRKVEFTQICSLLDLTIIIDLWTIEIFMNSGTLVFSELLNWDYFPQIMKIEGNNINNTVAQFNCWRIDNASTK
jgi:sucrose-6-phosphate hydrolase SacC (GH32 family)